MIEMKREMIRKWEIRRENDGTKTEKRHSIINKGNDGMKKNRHSYGRPKKRRKGWKIKKRNEKEVRH